MGNRLPWQQRDFSIFQLSEGVEGPDLAISNKLLWQQSPISAILRHKKLKFRIQIPLNLRKEFFRLLGRFDYHGNTKVSSCQPLLNIEC